MRNLINKLHAKNWNKNLQEYFISYLQSCFKLRKDKKYLEQKYKTKVLWAIDMQDSLIIPPSAVAWCTKTPEATTAGHKCVEKIITLKYSYS